LEPIIEEVQSDVCDVTLFDIDDNRVTLADFKGNTVILAGAGREGADEAREWGRKIVQKCESLQTVKYVRVAFVGKIPSFVPRKFIKGILKGSVASVPPLIAWDNEPAEKMGINDTKTPFVFVIDPDCILRLRFKGKYTNDALERIMEYLPR
jgi:hypothetical protein